MGSTYATLHLEPYPTDDGHLWLTLPQHDTWELIRRWHPVAKLDKTRPIVQFPDRTPSGLEYHEMLVRWLPLVRLGFLPCTQTVFTPGASICLDCPELTGTAA